MPEAADNKKRDDMDLSPENVEATQKIDINYSELALGKDAGRELADKIKEEHAVSSSSLLGKPVFSKKPLTDDYVKSASIVNAISSVPPLKDKLELLDIDSNYELKSELASGAQGIIRSAFDKSLQRDVVVKTLKTDEYEDDRSRGENLFVSEARIMAQLDHPSIIPLYGLHCGAENGLHLAMKHINGKTLREYLNDIVALYECENVDNFDEKRSIVKRIEYLIKVCEAVGYAHCKGVVHRDLKPENIMIGNYGEVYVMDWGLACLVHPGEKNGEEHEETQDYKNKLVGTPCYIAPEVIRGASCSPQSDIFSLGMILFEIVTLNRAVTGESVKEALTNIINSNYQPFRHRFLKTPLSPDLRAIVAKAICEPLSQRYKTAKDMADDLKLYLMREETSARPDNVVRKCVRGMINHKMITSIVILSILLCLAGAVIYSLYSRNVLITKQKARENMLAHFQYEASRKAYYMESIFFYFKNQLANVAHDAGKILNREPDSAVKVCSYEDFNRDSTAPGDYSYSPYYGIKVSLDRAVMKPGPGTALSDQLNRRIAPMEEIFKYMLFASDPDFREKSKTSIAKKILNTGAPLSWIYIGLKNGTMYSYPGKSTYVKNYDPRERPWYKKALAKKHSIIWSEPYQCAASAKIVIACTKCVFDVNNNFIGVVGMDISLDYIQKHLFNVQDGGVREYLLNSKGRIVLSSDFEYKRAKTDNRDVMVENQFPFKKEFLEAVAHEKVIFEAEMNGAGYIFALHRIPSLGYYYIEQMRMQKHL